MRPPSDDELRTLLSADPGRGWREFVDLYTPTLVALIERLGIRDRDEAMDLYTLVCQRLSEDNCARLRRRDPAQGGIAGWLAVVVRNVGVDWVRSRAGRRRLFRTIQQLDPVHQQVFQLYYWGERTPSEISEELTVVLKRPVGLIDVLGALDAIHEVLTERQYGELVSMTARSRPPVSLDAEFEAGRIDVPDPGLTADASVESRERTAAVDAALAALPAEDAAIVRLHYFQGLGLADVKRALHLNELSRGRIASILETLRALLTVPAGAGGRA